MFQLHLFDLYRIFQGGFVGRVFHAKDKLIIAARITINQIESCCDYF